MNNEKLIYKCIQCSGEFHTSSRQLDGMNCPKCKGILSPDRIEEKRNENEVIKHGKYTCLSCEHTDLLTGKRNEYNEIRFCPKCRGLFVNIWKLHKYEHLKRIETSNINLIEMEIQKQLLSILDTKFKNWQGQIEMLSKVTQIYSNLNN